MSEKKVKVLIVDDEEVNVSFLEEVLDIAGYDFISRNDGVEAMQVMQERGDEVDIILLDKMMPNMDGFTFMEKMKEHEEWSSIPIIMQTAAGTPSDVIAGNEKGAYYYLVKPFDQKMLLSLIRSALDEAGESSS